LFYKNPPLSEAVYFTTQNELNMPARAPGFSDNFTELRPPAMDSNLYLIFDVRTIRIEKGSATEPSIAIEPLASKKCYWTILPVASEKVPGQGFKYCVSGLYQLPLIEGPVPSNDLLTATNVLEEVLSRLSSKSKSNSLKLSDGCSLFVRILNPLLREVCAASTTLEASNIKAKYLNTLVAAAASGVSGSLAKVENFSYDPLKFPSTSKSTSQQLPKIDDLQKFQKNVNKAFAAAVKIPNY
jgi:hypothetical protein